MKRTEEKKSFLLEMFKNQLDHSPKKPDNN